MEKILIWNNKGGTGKTTLAFQLICDYAHSNPEKKVLAIDVCPQANLSELLLGGLHQGGSSNLLTRQGENPRASIGGYFQMRLPFPYAVQKFDASNFITKPSEFNNFIPQNIDLLCGDPMLELQANAISTLANTQVPGTNTWFAVISWLNDFIKNLSVNYDVIIFDANPSFSIYTQIAVAACEKVILPVMADDSSRRAIQNAFSLIYGLKLPSDIYSKYNFPQKLSEVGQPLPKVHLIIKNRITQYMGAASAYATVLSSIDREVKNLVSSYPNIFTFTETENGIVEVRDFQTTGVVSTARGCPFYALKSGRLDLLGRRVQIKEENRVNCIENIKEVNSKIF